MTLKAAMARVRKHLQRHAPTGMTAYVIYWPDTLYGVRVAECGWHNDRAGSVYMQSDPEGLPICAAIERAVIEHMGPARTPDDRNERARSLELLDWALKGGRR